MPLVDNVLAFARLLRSAGMAVAPTQVEAALQGLALVGIAERAQTFAVLAATLVTREQDRALFASAFDLFWRAEGERVAQTRVPTVVQDGGDHPVCVDDPCPHTSAETRSGERQEADPDRIGAWSSSEHLARRDFATLNQAELSEVERLLLQRRIELPLRATRRHLRAQNGVIDLRRTALDAMRHAGDVTHVRYRRRKRTRRHIVLLCDVSGSMARYARILLQLGVLLVRQGAGAADVFALDTRLTWLTRVLEAAPLAALQTRGSLQASWGGGTRLGACLQQFNRDWARRVLTPNALVVILSDGCDRGDVHLLAREMQRIKQRRARIIWVNPLMGDPHYQPLTAGMLAALPWIDDLVPGHNLMRVDALIDLMRTA